MRFQRIRLLFFCCFFLAYNAANELYNERRSRLGFSTCSTRHSMAQADSHLALAKQCQIPLLPAYFKHNTIKCARSTRNTHNHRREDFRPLFYKHEAQDYKQNFISILYKNKTRTASNKCRCESMSEKRKKKKQFLTAPNAAANSFKLMNVLSQFNKKQQQIKLEMSLAQKVRA